jgi:urease accessory protein
MAFVLTMAVGGLLGMAGIHILSVELGIAFSVLALGIALAAEKKLPVAVAMIVVAIFAIFHGHAHGTEMPVLASPLLYAAGFLLGTAAIHMGGVSIGAIAQQTPRGTILLRFAGAGIAGIGLHLMIG